MYFEESVNFHKLRFMMWDIGGLFVEVVYPQDYGFLSEQGDYLREYFAAICDHVLALLPRQDAHQLI